MQKHWGEKWASGHFAVLDSVWCWGTGEGGEGMVPEWVIDTVKGALIGLERTLFLNASEFGGLGTRS